MMPLTLTLKLQSCKSLCHHKLGSNIFLPLRFYNIQVFGDVFATEVTAKHRDVEQAKSPCTIGILVSICACVSMDWDEAHELVEQ